MLTNIQNWTEVITRDNADDHCNPRFKHSHPAPTPLQEHKLTSDSIHYTNSLTFRHISVIQTHKYQHTCTPSPSHVCLFIPHAFCFSSPGIVSICSICPNCFKKDGCGIMGMA